eukprot:SAG22_NODE_366_length_11615_cov_13.379125_6_plen_520_part_00
MLGLAAAAPGVSTSASGGWLHLFVGSDVDRELRVYSFDEGAGDGAGAAALPQLQGRVETTGTVGWVCGDARRQAGMHVEPWATAGTAAKTAAVAGPPGPLAIRRHGLLPGISHQVCAHNGVLYISGISAAHGKVDPDTFRTEARLPPTAELQLATALATIGSVLAANGSGVRGVLELTVCVVNAADTPVAEAAVAAWLADSEWLSATAGIPPPAVSVVRVQGLGPRILAQVSSTALLINVTDASTAPPPPPPTVRLHVAGRRGSAGGSAGRQARTCLAELSRGLAAAGSSARHVLTCTVWLSRFEDKPAFNKAWRDWFGGEDSVLPARAVVATRSADPQSRVAVFCVAAVAGAGGGAGPPQRLGRPFPGLFHLGVAHDSVLYLSGVSAELETGEDDLSGLDAAAQAAAVLSNVGRRLEEYGSSRASVLSATLFVTTMADKPAVNAAWTAWFAAAEAEARGCAGGEALVPARSTVCVDDLGPHTLFEVVLTAASPVCPPPPRQQQSTVNSSSGGGGGSRL